MQHKYVGRAPRLAPGPLPGACLNLGRQAGLRANGAPGPSPPVGGATPGAYFSPAASIALREIVVRGKD